MVPILGRPVMEHILRLLARHGFDDVIANLHYFPDLIREHFGDGSRHGIRLAYSYEPELLGTAGGVRNVRDHFGDETFLIISGDALTDIDLTALWRAPQGGGRHRHAGAEARRRPEPARRRDRRRRRPHPGLPGEARPRRGAVEPRQLRHLRVRARDLRLLPRPDVRRLGAGRLPGAARAGRAASTATRSASTGTTSARSRSTARATSTRSRARCEVEHAPGSRRTAGERPRRRRGRGPPVFIGEGCEIASGVRLTGPVVIGERLHASARAPRCATRSCGPAREVDAGTRADRRGRRRPPAARQAQRRSA